MLIDEVDCTGELTTTSKSKISEIGECQNMSDNNNDSSTIGSSISGQSEGSPRSVATGGSSSHKYKGRYRKNFFLNKNKNGNNFSNYQANKDFEGSTKDIKGVLGINSEEIDFEANI